tara:strand:- start:3084 stop:3350 length:267 start_codon:yes stop_codon:yes gene_type:complete
MTDEASAAMNHLKLARCLEENIFPINQDDLPNENHADPFGKIMVHSPVTGWHVIPITEITKGGATTRIVTETCDYYTFTPPIPPPLKS